MTHDEAIAKIQALHAHEDVSVWGRTPTSELVGIVKAASNKTYKTRIIPEDAETYAGYNLAWTIGPGADWHEAVDERQAAIDAMDVILPPPFTSTPEPAPTPDLPDHPDTIQRTEDGHIYSNDPGPFTFGRDEARDDTEVYCRLQREAATLTARRDRLTHDMAAIAGKVEALNETIALLERIRYGR